MRLMKSADSEPRGGRASRRTDGSAPDTAATSLSDVHRRLEVLHAEFSRALHNGLVDISARFESRLDQVARALDDRAVARLDAATADLHRSLRAGVETQIGAAGAAQAAAIDTRTAVESRTAALEDALAAVAARMETLRPDDVEGSREQIRLLAEDITMLRRGVDPAEASRVRAESQGRLEAALDRRDERLVEAISDLLTTVTSERVAAGTRLLQLEDTTNRVLDAVLALENRQATWAAESATQAADLLVRMHEGLDAVRAGVAGQLGRMREELSAELAAVTANAALAVEAGGRDRATLLERMAEHRTALSDRLDRLGELMGASATHVPATPEISPGGAPESPATTPPGGVQATARVIAEAVVTDLRSALTRGGSAGDKATADRPWITRRSRSAEDQPARALTDGAAPGAGHGPEDSAAAARSTSEADADLPGGGEAARLPEPGAATAYPDGPVGAGVTSAPGDDPQEAAQPTSAMAAEQGIREEVPAAAEGTRADNVPTAADGTPADNVPAASEEADDEEPTRPTTAARRQTRAAPKKATSPKQRPPAKSPAAKSPAAKPPAAKSPAARPPAAKPTPDAATTTARGATGREKPSPARRDPAGSPTRAGTPTRRASPHFPRAFEGQPPTRPRPVPPKVVEVAPAPRPARASDPVPARTRPPVRTRPSYYSSPRPAPAPEPDETPPEPPPVPRRLFPFRRY